MPLAYDIYRAPFRTDEEEGHLTVNPDLTRPILVVDDDPHLLEVVRLVLEHQGYKVVTAGNGVEALKRLESLNPALILLDMRMPVLDGRGFIREFRIRYGNKSPIVLFSAAEDTQALAGEINAEGFLEKPFDLSQLLSTIDRFIGKLN